MKAYVAEYAASISVETVHRVANHMRKRARACIEAEGAHFEHLMKQKNYDSDADPMAAYHNERDDDADLIFFPDDDDEGIDETGDMEINVEVGIEIDEEEELEFPSQSTNSSQSSLSSQSSDQDFVPPKRLRNRAAQTN